MRSKPDSRVSVVVVSAGDELDRGDLTDDPSRALLVFRGLTDKLSSSLETLRSSLHMMLAGLREVLIARKPAYAALQSVGSEAIVLGLNFLTGIVTARLLGPEGRGMLGAITIWQLLLALVATSGLQTAVVYRLRRNPELAGDIAAAAFVLAFASSTVVIAAGYLILPAFLRQYPPWATPVAQFCLLVVYANSVHVIFKQVFSGLGRFTTYNLASILPPTVYLVILGAAAALQGGALSTQAAAVALAIASPLVVALLVPACWRAAAPRWRRLRTTVGDLGSYTMRAAGSDLVTALAFLDRIILLPLVPAAAFGLYIVAYSFSRIILVVQPAINSVFFSNLAERTPAEAKILHDRVFRLALLGLGSGAAVLSFFDQALLSLVFGPEFAAAAPLFVILSVEAVASVLVNINLFLFMAIGRPSLATVCQVLGLSAAIVAMLALIPSFGAYGAAIGLLLAALLKLVILFIAMARSDIGAPSLLPRLDDFRFLAGKLSLQSGGR